MVKFALLLLGILIGAAGGSITVLKATTPLAAAGIFVCGAPQGVIVVQRDGDSNFFTFDDPAVKGIVDGIPKARRNMLDVKGKFCQPARPQVY